MQTPLSSVPDPGERSARLALALTPGLGPATYRDLLAHFGCAKAVFERMRVGSEAEAPATASLAPALMRALRTGEGARRARRAQRWADEGNNRALVILGDSDYPAQLAVTERAPPLLFTEGHLACATRPMVAIVGARRASAYGLAHTSWFAGRLAQAGVTVVSGLALGIDAAAHTAALDSGGQTLAVCATGLDRVYPQRHSQLSARITEQGLRISEFALGTEARSGLFPVRNRVIAGLCAVTLVVEARVRSGSMLTAGLAADAGREVCAVPGPIGNAQSAGPHQLIRDGAWLVSEPEEILALLPQPHSGPLSVPAPGAPSRDRPTAQVIDALRAGVARLDALVATTGLTPALVSSILTSLELEGALVTDNKGAMACTRRLE